MCDFYDNNGKPHSTCPRGILKRILQEAEKMGYYMKTRPELEWYFLDEDMDSAEYAVYMATSPSDSLQDLRRTIAEDMIEVLRPAPPGCLCPKYKQAIVGRELKEDIKKGSPFVCEQI